MKSLMSLPSKHHIAKEATSALGLLRAEAAKTIQALIQDQLTDHPHSICSSYRGTGEQLSREEKKAAGIRSNALMSRAAFSEISELGRIKPLEAHEMTLLRAVFTMNRARQVATSNEVASQLGHIFIGLKHETLHHDCAACNQLDGLICDPDKAHIFPPIDCRCTANYCLSPAVDWFVDVD